MNQTDTKSFAWPLLFTHRGTILGKGFLADIEFEGRVLATPELDGVWVNGVHPGAIAVGAATLADTYSELFNTLGRVFVDFAEQSSSFDEFKYLVEKFYYESDAETEQEWDATVAAVRAGRVNGPDGMSRRAVSDPYIKVTQKTADAVTPQDNTLVQQESREAYAYPLAA